MLAFMDDLGGLSHLALQRLAQALWQGSRMFTGYLRS